MFTLFNIYLSLSIIVFTIDLTKNKKIIFISTYLLIFLFTLIIGFREGIFISTDLDVYLKMYERVADINANIKLERIEPGFYIYMSLLKTIGFSDLGFLSLTAFITLYFTIFGLSKVIKYPLVVILLVLSTSFFYNFGFNTIRQGLAAAIFIYFLNELRIFSIKQLFVILVGFSIHFSFLFASILVVVANKIRLNFIHIVLLIISSLFMFLFSFENLILNILKILPTTGSMERTVVYALGSVEKIREGGKLYYLISMFLVILNYYYLKSLINLKKKYFINFKIYMLILKIIFLCVLLYPIMSDFGYMRRLLNYGFLLHPILIYGLMIIKFNYKIALFLILIYSILHYMLSLYPKNFLIIGL